MAVLFAASVLLIRYVAALMWTESGTTVAGEAWANAVYAAAGREFIPVYRRFPEEQAAYWMARTESLPDDPDLLCAAALILDEPSPAYRTRMLQRQERRIVEGFRGVIPPSLLTTNDQPSRRGTDHEGRARNSHTGSVS